MRDNRIDCAVKGRHEDDTNNKQTDEGYKMFELALTIALGIILCYVILWGVGMVIALGAGLAVAVAHNWETVKSGLWIAAGVVLFIIFKIVVVTA